MVEKMKNRSCGVWYAWCVLFRAAVRHWRRRRTRRRMQRMVMCTMRRDFLWQMRSRT